MKKKIMILTASTGGGHNKASRTIQDELTKIGIESEVIDSFKDVGKFGKIFDIMVSQGYEKSAKYVPKIYGKAYSAADKKLIRKTFDKNVITAYLEKTLLKKINEENFTHVIGTHPFPVIAVNILKKSKKTDIPLYSVITDYTVHKAHVAKYVDKYIVGHEDTMALLENQKIPKEKISPLGIPISIKDYSQEEIEQFKKQNSIDGKFTVLIMGGSFGAGNISKVYDKIKNLKEDINIIIICGRNEKLKEKLDLKIYENPPKNRTIIVGFTDEIEKYYQSSDVIITKPGGLTITECMHKKLPMIIPFFIPGQEEGNKEFLLKNQMAITTSKYFPLDIIIKTIVNDRTKLDIIKQSMEKNKKDDTSKKIANLFLD